MRNSLLCVLGTALASTYAAQKTQEWLVSHSSNGVDFARRGVLKLDEEGKFHLENDPLTVEQTRSLLEAPWYHVQVSAPGSNEAMVLQTVPSCHLRRANFKDEFQFTFPRVGSNDADIISMSYSPLISPLAPKSCDEYSPEALVANANQEAFTWTSKVEASLDTPAMTLRTVLPKLKPPPGLKWLQHPNARKGSAGESLPGVDDETQQAQDNRPFFLKYWYLIVPLLIANLLPAPEQPAAGGEAAAAAGGSAPAAAAAGAAAAGAAAQGSARRGKRG
mmetsp:Transcript_10120/g.29456  ORF Transcript_10120/g.29456 Transcript_10120/m.29456 type:complete len:277 (-) Transcript_10120:12-842(-)